MLGSTHGEEEPRVLGDERNGEGRRQIEMA